MTTELIKKRLKKQKIKRSKKMNENRTFQFYDAESGEDFFVEAKNKSEATKRAKQCFAKPKYIDEVTCEEAEMLGWDTY